MASNGTHRPNLPFSGPTPCAWRRGGDFSSKLHEATAEDDRSSKNRNVAGNKVNELCLDPWGDLPSGPMLTRGVF